MKKTYIQPELEVLSMGYGAHLMEVWSIGIDPNDPGIGPGDEDDIGAKQGFFDEEDDWAKLGFNAWED